MTSRISVLLLCAALCVVAWYAYAHRVAPYTDAGLAAYVAAERLDPIFAIEGTDPNKLQHAVTEFLAMRDRIAAQYHGKEKDAIESLYPATFLTLLPKLEAARQRMLAGPSVQSVTAYHNLLVQTIAAYAHDAEKVSALVGQASSTYPSMGFLAGTTQPGEVAQKIAAVGTQALAVQLAKEQERYACLTGRTSCKSLQTLMHERAATVDEPTPTPRPNATVTTMATLARRLYGAVHSYARTESILFAIDSTCVPTSTVAYVQAYYLSNQHGVGRKLSYTDDLYFYDIQTLHQKLPTRSVYGSLIDAGIAWQYQNSGNAYECPDSGYDQTSVGRLLGTLDLLGSTTPRSSEIQNIRSLTSVSKADLAPYVVRAAAADTPEANRLIERYVEGSSNFDQVLLGLVNDNGFLLSSTTTKMPPPSYLFVATTRNFASTLFMMGNPTFVPSPTSLFTSHTPPGLDSFFLRSYIHDLAGVVSIDTLVAQYKKDLMIEFPTTP